LAAAAELRSWGAHIKTVIQGYLRP
jgi:hypothetical protein